MTNTTSNTDDKPSRYVFSSARSHQDAVVVNDLAKMLVQTSIFINGAAATAVISLIGSLYASKTLSLNSLNSPQINLVFATIFLYILGLAMGLGSGISFMYMAQKWSEHWEQKYWGNDCKAQRKMRKALNRRCQAYFCLIMSVCLFVVAGIGVGASLIHLSSVNGSAASPPASVGAPG